MSHSVLIVLRNSLHSLGAALGLSLLLYPVSSLAATTPTYLVQPKVTGSFGIVSCGSYSIFTGSTPSPTTYCAQFIGNVNTTAVAGSQVAYLVSPKSTNQFGITSCGGYAIITGSVPNPNSYCSQLIGYPYASPVAGTTATYFACPLVTGNFGIVSCSGAYQIIKGAAPNPASYQSWLIGYTN